MSTRGIAVLLACVLMGLVSVAAAGQTPEGWTMPRTADGYPDLQVIWASDSATPLERPEQLSDRAALTDEEVSTLQARAAEEPVHQSSPCSRAASVGQVPSAIR